LKHKHESKEKIMHSSSSITNKLNPQNWWLGMRGMWHEINKGSKIPSKQHMQQLATSHKNFNLFAIGNETFILDYKVTLVMKLYSWCCISKLHGIGTIKSSSSSLASVFINKKQLFQMKNVSGRKTNKHRVIAILACFYLNEFTPLIQQAKPPS
jgi:hypothetical protein